MHAIYLRISSSSSNYTDNSGSLKGRCNEHLIKKKMNWRVLELKKRNFYFLFFTPSLVDGHEWMQQKDASLSYEQMKERRSRS